MLDEFKRMWSVPFEMLSVRGQIKFWPCPEQCPLRVPARGQLVCLSAEWASWLIGSVGLAGGRSVGGLVGRWVCPSVCLSVGGLVDQPVCRLVSWSNSLSVIQMGCLVV